MDYFGHQLKTENKIKKEKEQPWRMGTTIQSEQVKNTFTTFEWHQKIYMFALFNNTFSVIHHQHALTYTFVSLSYPYMMNNKQLYSIKMFNSPCLQPNQGL